MKYSITVIIEAITFDELVQYGRDNGGNIVNGMPWSFEYKGYGISHENDKCYFIPIVHDTQNMTPNDMLITGVTGELFIMTIEEFEKIYTKVEE